MTRDFTTAMECGLVSCRDCGMISKPVQAAHTVYCPRCRARINIRRPNSVASCWALLLAAYILYVPANLLPIMKTSTISGTTADTIMSGILTLWESGSWGIAGIVFLASITVPLLKLISLTLLLLSVRGPSRWSPEQRIRLYRLIKVVGRWSMLDIYVVAILTKLVQFSFLATVEAGPAAFYFAAVVVLTMIAAMQFDPRLIWDSSRLEGEHE